MIIPITLQEIDNALFSIDGTKAHGFNAKFFIETCHVIKPDIYAAVLDFFFLTLVISALTLVPKVANPTYASDFRLIACCTVVYNIIAKLITHRMQEVIGEVVDTLYLEEISETTFLWQLISSRDTLGKEFLLGVQSRWISRKRMTQLDGFF